MADDAAIFDAARAEAYSTPLEKIDVSLQDRFVTNTFWPFFERLRREDPVHYCAESEFGPYWSVTRFNDIVEVETHHAVFSSEGAISIYDPQPDDMQMPNFIAMDPPKHDEQRKTIAPIVSSDNLAHFAPLIRSRAAKSSTSCRSASPSTGSSASRWSSPAKCWRPCSTSRSRSATS
jgi:cytochrome P450